MLKAEYSTPTSSHEISLTTTTSSPLQNPPSSPPHTTAAFPPQNQATSTPVSTMPTYTFTHLIPLARDRETTREVDIVDGEGPTEASLLVDTTAVDTVVSFQIITTSIDVEWRRDGDGPTLDIMFTITTETGTVERTVTRTEWTGM
ncbi:Hypothetical protein D9617_34g041060 [Elsinoe fawcettii]|nr:Hypothetical protein D9617_34g041060 [Elsinoe fawcettii]